MSNNNFNIEDPYVPSAPPAPSQPGQPNVPSTQMPTDNDNSMYNPAGPANPNPPVSSVGYNVPQPPPPPVSANPVPSTVPPLPPDNKPVNEFIIPSNYSSGGKKFSKFSLFVIIGVIIIILIYGAVFYLYLQKKQPDANSNDQTAAQNQETTEVATQEAETSTPAFAKEFVKIVNGNVVYEDPNSGARVLVDKELFTSTGIAGFSKVTVSPDNSLLCFESWPPAPEPALFLANADGSNVVEVSPNRKTCTFTPDSKKIVYESIPSASSDILVYDINEKSETNLTQATDEANITSYSLVGLSQDGTKAVCAYESTDAEKTTGQCEIDLSSFEVVLN